MKKAVYIILIFILALLISFVLIKRLSVTQEVAPAESGSYAAAEESPVQTNESVSTPEPTPEPTVEPTEDPYTYDDMYSSIYSHTDYSDEARLENIQRAVKAIDGVIIMPGETFSFNDTVGSTADYNLAAVYDGTYPEDEVYMVGGGTSLVASTLYCSCLYGCMDPVERYPHHFWLTSNGYLKRGSDAYVCNNGTDDTYDMKFKNPFDTPVKIKAYLDDGSDKLYVELWGTNEEGWHAQPYFDNNSLYLSGEYSYVCNRYWVKNFRTVYNNEGIVREDDLNFDYNGNGVIDQDEYDVYWWHDRDLVWGGGGH